MATNKSSPRRVSVRVATNNPRKPSPLVDSPAQAKQEVAKLRRGRDRLDAELTTDETSVRSSLI